jgi:DNA-binding transcriptional MerR regulator
MRELESYSIDELEQLTGYDRRTISYYIAEGLLPKVGRRGRNTRYGREFVARLKFIQRVKDQQDAGKLPSVTLTDIGAIIQRLSADDIVEAGKSNKRLAELFAAWLGEVQLEMESPPLPAESVEASGLIDISAVADSWESTTSRSAPGAKKSSVESRVVSARQRRALHEPSSLYEENDELVQYAAMSAGPIDDSGVNEQIAELRAEMRDATQGEVAELRDMQRSQRDMFEQMVEEMRRMQAEMSRVLDDTRKTRHELRDEVERIRRLREELEEFRLTEAQLHQTDAEL